MTTNALTPLSLKRGTSATLTVTIPDSIDPAGAVVFMTVKPSEITRRKLDDDSLAIMKIVLTERTGRVFTKDIVPDDTKDQQPGRYVYGFTVKDAAGNILGTKANGEFVLEPRDTANTEVD